jgi:hypothetical protein
LKIKMAQALLNGNKELDKQVWRRTTGDNQNPVSSATRCIWQRQRLNGSSRLMARPWRHYWQT